MVYYYIDYDLRKELDESSYFYDNYEVYPVCTNEEDFPIVAEFSTEEDALEYCSFKNGVTP